MKTPKTNLSLSSKCLGCAFWEPNNPGRYRHLDDVEGECHRYPPQIDSVYAGANAITGREGAESDAACWQFPITWSTRWCGEFKKLEGPDQSERTDWLIETLGAYLPEAKK